MEEINNVRPKFLKILLILSFIGSSWNMFAGLSNALSEPNIEREEAVLEYIDAIEDGSEEAEFVIEDFKSFVSNINKNITTYGAMEFMLYAISLIGVFLMYQGRRIGFIIYASVQVLLLGSPIFFGGYNSISLSLTLVYSFITMVFLAMYSSQLKYLNN